MKFLIFFFLCFVALSAAAPQFLNWPFVGPAWGSRTLIAGPSVVNGVATPGFVGVI